MPRILLLEADRQLASHAKDYLRHQNHEVSHFCGPQEAITNADAKRPDIVIVDLSLADRSGIEFLYELRSYPDWQNVPVIATGWLSRAELANYSQAFRQLGVSAYMPKEQLSLSGIAAEVDQLALPAAS